MKHMTQEEWDAMNPGDQIFDKCYACGKVMKLNSKGVFTSDGQPQYVGPDCYKAIQESAEDGFQPARGGPRLFVVNPDPDAYHGNLQG